METAFREVISDIRINSLFVKILFPVQTDKVIVIIIILTAINSRTQVRQISFVATPYTAIKFSRFQIQREAKRLERIAIETPLEAHILIASMPPIEEHRIAFHRVKTSRSLFQILMLHTQCNRKIIRRIRVRKAPCQRR